MGPAPALIIITFNAKLACPDQEILLLSLEKVKEDSGNAEPFHISLSIPLHWHWSLLNPHSSLILSHHQ